MTNAAETTPRRRILPAHVRALVQWLVLVSIAFGVLAGGMTWVSRSVAIPSPAAPPASSEAGAGSAYPAPDFRLASLDGGQISPADYAGEVVVIDFWATWCGPCRLQAKHLEELHEEYDGKGVRFLAVDLGEDEQTVRRYVEKTPFPYPVLLDPRDDLSARYQILGLPTVMIIDKAGAISFLETGVSPVSLLRNELVEAGA